MTAPIGRAVVLAAVACAAVAVVAQSATIHVEQGALRVRAPAFHFITAQPLARLKDGRSVRFDFELRVLLRPGTTIIAEARQSCLVSYDLWEERFAVTLAASSRLVSHLAAADAETWCLDRMTVPVSNFRRRDDPFWIRIEYRVVDDERTAGTDDNGVTLRGLIDRLSRRRAPGDVRDAVEVGPFRLSN